MGLRGPKAKSQAQNRLSGDAGHRSASRAKAKAKAPKALAGIPLEPRYKWWSADHRRAWRRTAAELSRRNTMTKADWAILEAYCNAYATWCRANRSLGGELTFKTTGGFLGQRAEVSIMVSAEERMVKFAAKLGLSPVDRESAGIGFDEPEDEGFEKFESHERGKVMKFS